MAVDPGTMTSGTRTDGDGREPTSRTVKRARGLPGGRAVVGAFLVAAAAVAVFAAYLNATAEPDTRYLVARAVVEPGTRVADTATLGDLFELEPLALEGRLADNAFTAGEAAGLVGQVVLVPLSPGDLLQRSGVAADGGIADAEKLSFAVEPSAALGGRIQAGERIDVLATYGSGDTGWTSYVVRSVPVIHVVGGDGGLTGGSGGPFVVTVAVSDPREVQALAHAVQAADIVLTRSTVAEGDTTPAPGPYTPSRDEDGPRPDPAGDAVDAGTADAPGDGTDEAPAGADGPTDGPGDEGDEGDG